MKKDIYSFFNNIIVDDIESEPLNETEVNNIMKKFNDKKILKKTAGNNKRFILGTVAAAAAVAMIVPASVYAYNKAASISKTAKYQNTVVISANSEGSSEDTTENPWEIELMDYEFGWLPEGFTKRNDDWRYYNEADESIDSYFFRLPDGKSTKIDLPYSENCETYESNGKTAMINYRVSYENSEYDLDYGDYGREIWVSFDGTNYLLELYLSDGISQEDTKKIIDNLKLVPTDVIRYNTYLPWEDTVDSVPYQDTLKEVDMEKCEVYHVGDTISYPGAPHENSGYSITLNSAEITDSFDGINTDGCGDDADYSELMDENGNIAKNTRSWIKRGDGVNTIDEVVKEEIFPLHILKLNVTYTNIADETNYIIINPHLFRFTDSKPYIHHYSEDGLDYEDSIFRHIDFGHFSFDTAPDKKRGENSVILEPGESTDVQLAFFVADDEADKMQLYFRMSGGNLSVALERKGCPIYDLRPE